LDYGEYSVLMVMLITCFQWDEYTVNTRLKHTYMHARSLRTHARKHAYVHMNGTSTGNKRPPPHCQKSL